MNDHQRGIYQPASDNAQVYDLADDDSDDEERSRLPLMIVVAFIVLAAFTGVVWLAYNQGVARGRSGAAVVINAPDGPVRTAPAEAGGGTPFTGLKIYSQPLPPDQEAQGSAVASASSGTSVAAAPAPAASRPAATEAPPARLNPELRTATPAPAVEAPKVPAPAPQPAVAQPSAPPPPAIAQAARPAPQPLPAAPPPAAAPPPRPAVQTAQAAPAPATPRQLPPAPPPAPSAPAAASSALAGTAVLQIGAFESEALANGAWATFKTRHADVVGGLSEDIQKADLGARGTFYRLRVGPFKDRASAVAACEKLKTQRASCLVAAP